MATDPNAPTGDDPSYDLDNDPNAWGDGWGDDTEATGDSAISDGPIADDPISDGPMADGPIADSLLPAPASQVAPAAFAPLPSNDTDGNVRGIDMLMDISLQISVELGRTRMKIGEILSLRSGSVLELDKLAGEPADILVNGTLIARGEVVVVDEKFGVRVLEVVSQAKRLASIA